MRNTVCRPSTRTRASTCRYELRMASHQEGVRPAADPKLHCVRHHHREDLTDGHPHVPDPLHMVGVVIAGVLFCEAEPELFVFSPALVSNLRAHDGTTFEFSAILFPSTNEGVVASFCRHNSVDRDLLYFFVQ